MMKCTYAEDDFCQIINVGSSENNFDIIFHSGVGDLFLGYNDLCMDTDYMRLLNIDISHFTSKELDNYSESLKLHKPVIIPKDCIIYSAFADFYNEIVYTDDEIIDVMTGDSLFDKNTQTIIWYSDDPECYQTLDSYVYDYFKIQKANEGFAITFNNRNGKVRVRFSGCRYKKRSGCDGFMPCVHLYNTLRKIAFQNDRVEGNKILTR